MTKDNERPTIALAIKHFAEGATRPVTPPIDVAGETVMIQCTDGAFQSMWHHARRGLPKSEDGGTVSGDQAIEVKGYLLGIVEMRGDTKVVIIKEVVQLPFSQNDAGDAAYFNAKDRAILETKLRAKPGLQMVGNYHSHPNHDIKLSDQDVVYLSQYLTEPFHVAAIVGPREPAVGFFLKNAVGEYVPWQEPDSRVEFRENGMPDITQEKDASGNIIIRTGKKVNWRLFGIIAAVLAVGIFVVARMTAPPPRAIMKAGADQVVINATDEGAKRVALYLDGGQGRFNFVVDATTVPSWLDVAPMEGVITRTSSVDLILNVDWMDPAIALGDSVPKQITVLGRPDNDRQPDRANIMIIAVADMRVVPIDDDWDLAPVRVRDGTFSLDLSDGPAGDDLDVTARLLRFETDTWVQVGRIDNPGPRLHLGRDGFGPPLEWDQVKIEVTGVRTLRAPDRVMRYVYRGSSPLFKQKSAWDLDPPTPVENEDELRLVTKPLAYPASYALTARRMDGREESLGRGLLDPGQSRVLTVPFDKDLHSIIVRAAFVGEDRVQELEYTGVIQDVVNEADLAFDSSQGRVGKAFRRNHPDFYKQSNLKMFGEIRGPRHFDDIPLVGRWGRLRLVSNRQVHESWRELVKIGQQALVRGDGQMAWRFDEPDTLRLFFVFPDGPHDPRLVWLFQHDEIRKLFAEEIEKGIAIRFQTGPIENPDKKGWRGY